MQITNLVVCDMSKGVLYKQIKPPLVGEHAFTLTGFVCMKAHVTFGGSGEIMSTARPELPYQCSSQAKSGDETSRRGLFARLLTLQLCLAKQFERRRTLKMVDRQRQMVIIIVYKCNFGLW